MASSDPSPGGDEREVLAGLPNARPHRRSAKRDRPARAGATRRATGATATSKGKAKPKPASTTKAKPKAASKAQAATVPKVAPAAEPAAKVPPAGWATPRDDVPRGADLLGTVVQAAGELAQIGITAGGRALKSAVQRLPRP
jgi:hypothetical protein